MSDQDLLSVDAEYLCQYINIVEGFMDKHFSLRNATNQLKELNDEFANRVSKRVLKSEVISGPVYMTDPEEYESSEDYENRDEDDDGWMPSSVC